MIDWISTFSIDTPLGSFDQIYTGVALFEILMKIDANIWSKSKLVKVSPSQVNAHKMSAQNYKHIVH